MDKFEIISTMRESGKSWFEIGDSLGVSKQAAHALYQRRFENYWQKADYKTNRDKLAIAEKKWRKLNPIYN